MKNQILSPNERHLKHAVADEYPNKNGVMVYDVMVYEFATVTCEPARIGCCCKEDAEELARTINRLAAFIDFPRSTRRG